jgi:hypothetical protein
MDGIARAVHAKTIQRKHAAGIDMGATSIYVAVPVDRDAVKLRTEGDAVFVRIGKRESQYRAFVPR